MPSQISLRTSTVLSSNNIQTVSSCDGAGSMKAAARTVGSFLITHNTSIRKPLAGTFNGSCDIVPDTPKCVSMTLINGNGAVSQASNHLKYLNGIDTPPLEVGHLDSPKTEGQHSDDQGSITDVSNKGRLMCPELALSYTNTLMGKRAGCLATKQRNLEQRVTSLQRKIRLRQLHTIHSHACRQLHFDPSNEQESEQASVSSLTDSNFSMVSSPGGGVENGGEQSMDLSIHVDGGGEAGAVGSDLELIDLPIQVDCASDDAFFPPPELVEDQRGGGRVSEESFSSLDSCPSEVEEMCGAEALTAQLASLEGLLDGELTDASEEEEGAESADIHCKHDLRCFWDYARSAVGSRWVWLQRRIAELNKQIYRLDHHVKESLVAGKCVFSAGPALAPTAAVLPQYMPLANGSVFERLSERLRTANGGGLLAMGKAGVKPVGGAGTNGFSHHHPTGHVPRLLPEHSTGHAQCLPHLLLPEGLLGSKLQVKDLLSPSPAERNMLFMSDATFTAARTRALVHRGNKRVVRRKGGRGRGPPQPADVAFHPHLSMAHELPSRIPLDSALKNVLSQHSYAHLPPLSKRRKAAASLTQLSTPLPCEYEHSQSPSPSPVYTITQSLDSSRDWSGRKKHPVQFLHCHTSAVDSSGGSPWSPGLPPPSTPISFTPLARKKRVTNSTPLFDIDNIVIPYSMAASTRLEKLEYKEILTPSWREVPCNGDTPPSSDPGKMEEEDYSSEAFSLRHGRCELREKKRFMNFISGSQRKRSRPQSMTLDLPPLASPPPPPRRATIATPSPTQTTESEVHAVVLPWQPRLFPLNEAELESLVTPPPPPPPPIFTPQQFTSPRTSTPSKTPSCPSSGLATPVASPAASCCELTPTLSPVEWIVNSHAAAAATGLYHHTPSAESALPTAPVPQNPIILKLTKKV